MVSYYAVYQLISGQGVLETAQMIIHLRYIFPYGRKTPSAVLHKFFLLDRLQFAHESVAEKRLVAPAVKEIADCGRLDEQVAAKNIKPRQGTRAAHFI